MTKCELCECSARMYCESDQASLCWDCDEKVHSANFLVAKHTRCLLCHVCQSLTPWKASGPKLGPTVSVCEACVTAARYEGKTVQRENQSDSTSGPDETDDEDDYDNDDDDEEEEEDLDEEGEDEEEEDENQVVPWSEDSPSSPPPPPVSSSSCSSFSNEDVSLKRMRDFADILSDDEIGCSSQPSSIGVHINEEAAAAATLSSFRPLKQPRTTISDRDQRQADTRSTAIISSLQRLQNQMITNNIAASATIFGICRLSRDKNR